jgi:hypothetical protein
MTRCEECGAPLEAGRACRDYFNDLLAREWEVPGGPGEVAHFLAVASYNLQHPSAFEPEPLSGLGQTLSDILAGKATIAEARRRARKATEGPNRVRRRPGDPARQPEDWPSQWSMTVRDVCDSPPDRYIQRVRDWAVSVQSSIARANPGG